MNRLDNPAVFAVAALGIEPHDAQLDYMLNDHQTKVISGGRRSGKTSVLAMEMIYKAVVAIHENRPFQQLIAAPSVDQARILFNTVAKLLLASPLGGIVEDQVASPFPELQLSRGGKIFLRDAQCGGVPRDGHQAPNARPANRGSGRRPPLRPAMARDVLPPRDTSFLSSVRSMRRSTSGSSDGASRRRMWRAHVIDRALGLERGARVDA